MRARARWARAMAAVTMVTLATSIAAAEGVERGDAVRFVLRQRARGDDEAIGDGARAGRAGTRGARRIERVGREETIDAADDVRNGDVRARTIRAERARGTIRARST